MSTPENFDKRRKMWATDVNMATELTLAKAINSRLVEAWPTGSYIGEPSIWYAHGAWRVRRDGQAYKFSTKADAVYFAAGIGPKGEALDDAGEPRKLPDIVAVLGEYLRLEPAGPNLHRGRCPFDPGLNKSLLVDAETQAFSCSECGSHGDVVEFTRKYQLITRAEAEAALAELKPAPTPSPGGRE